MREMLEKGRISPLQMTMIMHPTITATAILLVPAITAKYAKQDLWISPILASFIGFFTVFVIFQLNKNFPEKTFIEYCTDIIGKIPGKVIGIFYLIYYLHQTGIIIQEYGQFVVGNFLHQTPLVVVMVSMVLVCASAVYGGLEVIGRTSQIILPVVGLFFILVVIMLLKDLDFLEILPIFERGPMPALMGAYTPSGWFSEMFLISFMLPYLKQQQKGLKWGMICVFSIVLIMVIANLVTYMLFGPLTEFFTYPVMNAVRYISIAEFLEHLEAIIMAIWVASTFIKISMFYYVIVLGAAQWLNLSDFRPIILPIGFLLIVVSIWSTPNLLEMVHFLSTYEAIYLIVPQTFIPLILLGILWVRKKVKGSKRGNTHAQNA